MKQFVLFLCFCLYSSTAKSVEKDTKCDGVYVHGKYHKKEILAKGLNRPYHLVYYEPGNKIYFSENSGNDTEDTFKIAVLKKEDNETKVDIVHGVHNGFATAIDDKNHIAYFGGSKGIYKANLKKNENATMFLEGHDIWELSYHKELYFIVYPTLHLYKLNVHKTHAKPEKQEHISHTRVYHFIIDGFGDMFVKTDTGLYIIKNESNERILYSDMVFRGLTLHRGNPYFLGQNGIYVPEKHNHTLKEVAKIRNIFGLTFDHEDHIIYSDPHEIVKLVPEDPPKDCK